jgi:hypothetical protein
MKWWIDSRKGTPAVVAVKRNKFPTVAFEDDHHSHAKAVSWQDFFDLFIEHELAFMYEADHEDMNKGAFCKFVPWGNYVDEIRDEERKEDRAIIAENCFS